MSEQTDYENRKSMARTLNIGKKPGEVAQELSKWCIWRTSGKAIREHLGKITAYCPSLVNAYLEDVRLSTQNKRRLF